MEGTLCTKPGTGSSHSQIFWMADHLSSQLLIIDCIHVDTGTFCLIIPTWLPLRTHLPPPPSPHYLGWMSSSPGLQGYTHELAKPPHLLATVGRVRIQIIPVRLTPKNCEEDGSKSCWGHQVERTYLREKLPRVKHFWGKRRKKDRREEKKEGQKGRDRALMALLLRLWIQAALGFSQVWEQRHSPLKPHPGGGELRHKAGVPDARASSAPLDTSIPTQLSSNYSEGNHSARAWPAQQDPRSQQQPHLLAPGPPATSSPSLHIPPPAPPAFLPKGCLPQVDSLPDKELWVQPVGGWLTLKGVKRERKKVKSLSCIQLFVTPWTVARQAPLSLGFFRPEY